MNAGIDRGFWSGKRVFLTGHTGFKGSWLAFWLAELGAKVTGFALAPNTNPAMFNQLGLAAMINHRIGDIRDRDALTREILDSRPDVVLHLAAQPIVSEGYRNPVETYETNIMGVVHLLEACRELARPIPVLVVSSDKCYRNNDDGRAFQIEDPLGGFDPYSSSKAGTEIVAAAYRSSFFANPNAPIIASARAGNVIGGGDWSLDRLLPDGARAFIQNEPLVLRNPAATRPWQHVVEPLYGYLVLVQAMAKDRGFAAPWNFGPSNREVQSVGHVAEIFARAWGNWAAIEISTAEQDWHEAKALALDCSITETKLGWRSALDLEESIQWTADWYRTAQASTNRKLLHDITRKQISDYVRYQSTRS